MPFQLFPVSGFSGMVYFCKNKKAQEVNLNHLGANPTNLSDTLKQFVGNSRRIV